MDQLHLSSSICVHANILAKTLKYSFLKNVLILCHTFDQQVAL